MEKHRNFFVKGLFCRSRILFVLLFLLGSRGLLFSDTVLATNAWTAAFAAAAGVQDVLQLAPSNMLHPPEYELRPSDVKKLSDADLVIYAGYENMMKTITARLGKGNEALLKITTSYDPQILGASVMKIAGKAGDPARARAWLAGYDKALDEIRRCLKDKKLYGAPVLVHFHQKALARALGFQILGGFGPAPLKASEIGKLGKMKPVLILDNGHNPMASPLEELCGIKALELVNFPGGTDHSGKAVPSSLKGVLKRNGALICGKAP